MQPPSETHYKPFFQQYSNRKLVKIIITENQGKRLNSSPRGADSNLNMWIRGPERTNFMSAFTSLSSDNSWKWSSNARKQKNHYNHQVKLTHINKINIIWSKETKGKKGVMK